MNTYIFRCGNVMNTFSSLQSQEIFYLLQEIIYCQYESDNYWSRKTEFTGMTGVQYCNYSLYFCTSKTMCWVFHTWTCYIMYVCANCWCEHSAWFHLMIRQTMSQKWGMLFSSLRCSCRIDDFSYMSSIFDGYDSHDTDFWHYVTLVVTENHDNCITKITLIQEIMNFLL